MKIDPIEQNARYYFAILNDKREIEKIKSNIVLSLGPIDNYLERSGQIGNLKYLIMTFTAWKEIQDRVQIYRGKIKRDSNLYEREKSGIDGLEEYVKKEFSNL